MKMSQMEREGREDDRAEQASAAPGKVQLLPAGGGEASKAEAPRGHGGGEGAREGGARMEAWSPEGGLMAAMGLDEGEGGEGGGGAEGAGAKPAPRQPLQRRSVQRKEGAGSAGGAGEAGGAGGAGDAGGLHAAAAAGVSGTGGPLPHLEAIQHSFGRHDVSGVSAHTDGAAGKATEAMGAEAYATGNSVAFSSGSPSLHTAAHEAAHVVQQRGGVQLKGGVGEVGDAYERHADEVADRVVAGQSAEALLDGMAGGGDGGASAGRAGGVQQKALQFDLKSNLRKAVKGWGTDEELVFRSIATAPISEVMALTADGATLALVDGDLNDGEQDRFRGAMARRLYFEAGNAVMAFRMCMASKKRRAKRLGIVGNLAVQRHLLDLNLVAGTPNDAIIHAFQAYWDVETTAVEGATAWPPSAVIAIHQQMKLLPSQDTRAGVWKELQLTGNADLISRAAWNGRALIVGSSIDPATAGTMTMGYGSTLTAPAAPGHTALDVLEGARFAVGDVIAIDRDNPALKDTARITAITGNRLSLHAAMTYAHGYGAKVTPDDDSALHQVPYLDATVRHEIAHAVETAMGGVTGFTVGLGGWWTGTDIDLWTTGMANPWTPNDGSTINAKDLATLKKLVTEHVTGRKGSLAVAAMALDPTHPLVVNLPKQVPALVAAEACLSAPQRGDDFWKNAGAIYASGGRRFSVSGWYKCFMQHKEEVVGQRLADYQLYAPAEFFAEAYTVFYEEAHKLGTPGFSEADLGRHIRNAGQREWIRTNVHNRGQAPAVGKAGGAKPGGAHYGKHGGNPG